jgi:hypothetical protein
MMNDSDLFYELQEGMRERADRIDVPPGLAAEARRAARRRAAGRALTTGVPVLAVAGAAAVLTLGGGSGTSGLATSGPHGSASPISTGLAPHVQDVAYIVRRVRTHLARLAVAGEGQVLEQTTMPGNGSTDHPASNNTDWMYIDPQSGAAYQRSVDSSADGTYLQTNALVTAPTDGSLHTRVTSLDPSSHTYFTSDSAVSQLVNSSTSATQLGIRSTEQQIEQALADGRVTQEGTAIVDGQSTIELSVPPASQSTSGQPAHSTITLYVNSQTDQPVREVDVSPNNADDPSAGNATTTLDWLPTTAASIALTKVQIPANYTQVSGPKTGYWTPSVPLTFLGY